MPTSVGITDRMSFPATVFLTAAFLTSLSSDAIPLNDDTHITNTKISSFDTQDLNLINSERTDTGTGEVSCSECGVGDGNAKVKRIINGDAVNLPHKYPWMVALRTRKGNYISHCGGSIISERFILTSAHCYKGATEVNVKRSEVLLMTESPTNLSKGKAIEEVIFHDKYANGSQYDIALVKLKEPIKCTAYARPVCLPPDDYKPEPGDEFITAGWGRTNSSRPASRKFLREAVIVNQDLESCKTRSYFGPNVGQALCLKGKHNTSVCHGDSGGSMFKIIDGKFYIVGVTMGVISKCDPKVHFFFMSAPHFVEWIHNKTGLGTPRKVKA